MHNALTSDDFMVMLGIPRHLWTPDHIEEFYSYTCTENVWAQVVNDEWCVVAKNDRNELTTTKCSCKWEAMLKAADTEDIPF